MKAYLWVAFGSALGGAARYWCASAIDRHPLGVFPWGILAVNLLGSILIGLLATLAGPAGRPFLGPAAQQLFMTGVLGGFTTFSAFSLLVLDLARGGRWEVAAAYVAATLLLCLAGVWLGSALAAMAGR